MEYIYAIMLLNEADKELNEENLTRVLEAADVEVSSSRIKAAVASLEGLAVDDVVTKVAEEEMEDVEARPTDMEEEEDPEALSEGEDKSELPEGDS